LYIIPYKVHQQSKGAMSGPRFSNHSLVWWSMQRENTSSTMKWKKFKSLIEQQYTQLNMVGRFL